MNSDNKFGVRHHDAAFMGADASAPRGGRPATKSGDTSPQSKLGSFGVRPHEAAFGGADASAPSETRPATESGDTSPQSKFKDSGVEWLGEVPEEWTVLKLKRIAFIDYGIGLELDRTLLNGTPIISLPNIPINGELNLSDVPFVELNPNEKKDLLLKKGDLLFNWRNGSSDHVGKTALFNEDGEYTHVSFLLRIRFKSNEFHSKYFHRYLNSLRYTGFFLSTKAGVNNTFNQSELKEMDMVIPPTNEQLAIAEFIEKETFNIDKMIIKIQDCIDKIKEYRSALISAAVTGKIDLRGEAA